MARKLALVLRHAPEKFDLRNGHQWLDRRQRHSKEIQRWWQASTALAEAPPSSCYLETDPKGRYEVRGNMMRATYGHTVEIELDLPSSDIPDSLYYPCDPGEAGNLVEVGISPGDRLMSIFLHRSGMLLRQEGYITMILL